MHLLNLWYIAKILFELNRITLEIQKLIPKNYRPRLVQTNWSGHLPKLKMNTIKVSEIN